MNIIEALLQHLTAPPADDPNAPPPGSPVQAPSDFLTNAAPQPVHPVVQALTSQGGLIDMIRRKALERQQAVDAAANQ